MLDWLLIIGVLVLGAFLAVHFEKKYKMAKLDFLFTTLYVAGMASILIAAYHVLRRLFGLAP